MEQQYFSVKDTAQLMGLSELTVRRLVDSGDIPASKVGNSSRAYWRISRVDIEGYMQPQNIKLEKQSQTLVGRSDRKWV